MGLSMLVWEVGVWTRRALWTLANTAACPLIIQSSCAPWQNHDSVLGSHMRPGVASPGLRVTHAAFCRSSWSRSHQQFWLSGQDSMQKLQKERHVLA